MADFTDDDQHELRKQKILEAKLAAQQEQELLEEKRKQIEAQKKKRSSFLSDMDNFSQSIETRKLENEEERKVTLNNEASIIGQEISQASSNFKAPISTITTSNSRSQLQATSFTLPSAATSEPIEKKPFNAPHVIKHVPIISNEPEGPSISLGSNKNNSNFGKLTDSLLATGANIDDDRYSIDIVNGRNPMMRDDSNIESLKSVSKVASSGKTTFTAMAPQSAPSTRTGTSSSNTQNIVPILNPYGSKQKIEDDDDDDDDDLSDEEGSTIEGEDNISSFLTPEQRKGLTPQQKSHWRALQADLSTRRKDFHGAVTYAFDGIFSWQMYGSAEAVDESGKSYTEYLMRCQWGTNWENMQPWIAARRFREFEQLDSSLRKHFALLSNNLCPMPEKDFFRFLDAEVVERRRIALEDYMARIVTKLPSILRSEVINEFLGIGERIASIRAKICGFDTPRNNNTEMNNEEGSRDGIDGNATFNMVVSDNDIKILSMEDAEKFRNENNSGPLDEDELGRLEEDIRDLVNCLRHAAPQDALIGPKIRLLLKACTTRWPSLRATANVSDEVDFSLIPRAMQAEEDLINSVNEFKSLIAAHTLE